MSDANDTARPRFYMQAVENKFRSEEEGRPIFDEREMVEIRLPGDRLSCYVGYVTDEERNRWPEAYAAFKRGEQRAAHGTPLEHWPVLSTGKVAELKAMGILSVEELAAVQDNTIIRMGMGARELREQANAFINAARDGAGVAQYAAENERMKEQLALVQQQLAELLAANASKPAQPEEKPADKPIEDCTIAELRAFVERETGETFPANATRPTILARALEIAQA